jgi:acyl dehydratase
MQFDLSRLGQWTPEATLEITEEMISSYAAATNDANPPHATGKVASPVFAVVPSLMGVMTEALWSVAVSDREGYDTRNVHGEQDLFLERPILAGMVLRSRAATVGIHAKSSGTIVVTRTETRDQEGALVNFQYFVNFIRGVFAEQDVGELAPTKNLPEPPYASEPVQTSTYHVDKDQTVRYAAASGDHGSYHLDERAARDAGHPGLILHGLCTMAFAGRAVVESVCGDDSTRLRRLAVRFSKPVLLDQNLTTSIRAAGHRDGRAVYSFETTDESNEPVLTRGVAEVAT